jgi:hypothetical protein
MSAATALARDSRIRWEVIRHTANGRFIVAVIIDSKIVDYQVMTATEVEGVCQ